MSSHFLGNVFHKADILNFKGILFINYLIISYVFVVVSPKSWPCTRPYRFSPMLSSRSFVVLHFLCRSIICFKVCEVYNACVYFCIWLSSFSSIIYWKDYIFFIILPLLLLCQKLVDCIYVCLFLDSLFVHWSILSPIPHSLYYCFFLSLSFFFFFAFFRAAPVAYGGSQARGLIGPVAAGLCQSHSNARSKPHLWPTPQLTATLDP